MHDRREGERMVRTQDSQDRKVRTGKPEHEKH
jgi:hypothetical protein